MSLRFPMLSARWLHWKKQFTAKNKSKTLQKTKVNRREKPNHFCGFH